MQQKTPDGGPPDFDLERCQLFPQRRDRQIGLRRDQSPHLVFMLSQRVPLMAAELARQTIACCLPLKPSGTLPPIHMPLRFDAAILSRMRSPAISRSNWANDSSMLSVRRPIEVVVLNCCVTDTKDALWASSTSTILAKSASERVSRSTL